MHTVRDPLCPLPIELGAEFSHGEATSVEGRGTVIGAIESGRRAAKQLISSLRS